MASEKGREADAPLHGVSAEFGSADALLACVRALQPRRFGRLDTFSPVPVAGLEAALGIPGSPLRRLGFVGVAAGFAASMGLCVYATVYDYPFDIGGRPTVSWPAFVVPSVSFAMLAGALLVYLAMLFLNRLPHLNHPAFNIPGFERATQDRFFVSVDAEHEALDAAGDRGRPRGPGRPPARHHAGRPMTPPPGRPQTPHPTPRCGATFSRKGRRASVAFSPCGRRWPDDVGSEGSRPLKLKETYSLFRGRGGRSVPVLALASLLLCTLLAGCDRADMVAQDKSRTWDKSAFFPRWVDHAAAGAGHAGAGSAG